jgi:hypothetical protein
MPMQAYDHRRPAHRRGRWTYDGTTGLYGEAGWHLDGTPLVIDFMPGNHQCCNGGPRCCKGCYLLYGWRGNEHEPMGTHVDYAMEVAEEYWDALSDHERTLVTAREPVPFPGWDAIVAMRKRRETRLGDVCASHDLPGRRERGLR